MLLSRGNGWFNIQAFCSAQACQLSTYCTQRKLLPILCTFASLCVKSPATPTAQFKVPHQNHNCGSINSVLQEGKWPHHKRSKWTSCQPYNSSRCADISHDLPWFSKAEFYWAAISTIFAVLLSNIAVGSFLQSILYALNAHDELAGTSDFWCLGFLQQKHGWYVTEIRTKGQGKQNKEI